MGESRRDDIAKLEMLYAEHPEGRVFTHLAEAYRRAGRLDRAREVLEKGLSRHSDYASAHVVHGRVLLDEGRSDDAAAAFHRVLELDPHNLVALKAVGDIAFSSGRVDDAGEAYRRLLAVDPTNDEARAALETMESSAPEAATEPDSIGSSAGMDLGWELPDDEDAASSLDGLETTTWLDEPEQEAVGETTAWLDAPEDEAVEGTRAWLEEPQDEGVEFTDADLGMGGDPGFGFGDDVEGSDDGREPGEEFESELDEGLDLTGALDDAEADEFDASADDAGSDAYSFGSSADDGRTGLDATSGSADDDVAGAGPEATARPDWELPDIDFAGAADQDVEAPPWDSDEAHSDGERDDDFAAVHDEGFEPSRDDGFEPGDEAFEPGDEGFEPRDEGFEPGDEAFEPGHEAFEPASDGGFGPPEPDFGSDELVTETIADLYAEQGLREKAADMYRRLLDDRPGDARLEAKLAALEAVGFETGDERADADEEPAGFEKPAEFEEPAGFEEPAAFEASSEPGFEGPPEFEEPAEHEEPGGFEASATGDVASDTDDSDDAEIDAALAYLDAAPENGATRLSRDGDWGEDTDERADPDAGGAPDEHDAEEDVSVVESFWTGGVAAHEAPATPYAWGGEDGEAEEGSGAAEGVAGQPIAEYFDRLLGWRPSGVDEPRAVEGEGGSDAGDGGDSGGPGDGDGFEDRSGNLDS